MVKKKCIPGIYPAVAVVISVQHAAGMQRGRLFWGCMVNSYLKAHANQVHCKQAARNTLPYDNDLFDNI